MEEIIKTQIEKLTEQRNSLILALSDLDPHAMNYYMKETTLNNQILQIDSQIDLLLNKLPFPTK